MYFYFACNKTVGIHLSNISQMEKKHCCLGQDLKHLCGAVVLSLLDWKENVRLDNSCKCANDFIQRWNMYHGLLKKGYIKSTWHFIKITTKVGLVIQPE